MLEAKPDQSAMRAPASESVPVAEPAPVPPSLEEKYKDKSVADLVAARIQIEKRLAVRCGEIMEELIKRGRCEVLTRKYGEETKPKMPSGWAARMESTGLGDGTELVRFALFDPLSQPDTKALVEEAEWLAHREKVSAGDPSMGSDHQPR